MIPNWLGSCGEEGAMLEDVIDTEVAPQRDNQSMVELTRGEKFLTIFFFFLH